MKLPPLSYTILRDYENCPRKAYRKHVAKDLPKEKMGEALAFGITAHAALERAIKQNVPGPAAYEHLLTPLRRTEVVAERQLGMTQDGRDTGFFDADVWLRGKLDVSAISTDRKSALLLDWKTGKKREDRFELDIQALLLKATVPSLQRIVGAYVWLQDASDPIGEQFDLSNTADTMTVVQAVAEGMRARTEPAQWTPKPNPLCGWCPVKDCEHNRSRD